MLQSSKEIIVYEGPDGQVGLEMSKEIIVYEGHFRNAKRHGCGVSRWPNGNTQYQGEWEENRRQGTGQEYTCKGALLYEGEWVNNQRHGEGTLYRGLKSNGELYLFYKGSFDEGEFNGYGILYHRDGSVAYEGMWQYDMKHGFGTTHRETKDEIMYEGGYEWGARHGIGERRWLAGSRINVEETIECRYKGEWEHGVRNGHGCVVRGSYDVVMAAYNATGCVPAGSEYYEGMWKDDTRSGKGKYVRSDMHYEGDFENGVLHGDGRFINLSDDTIYQGAFHEGRKHGKGVLRHVDGTFIYDGEWKHGKKHGVGTHSCSGGRCYTGVFAGGIFHAERTKQWKAEQRRTFKRKREEEQCLAHRCKIVKMHEHAAMAPVPQCVLCGDHIHHGDVSFAYVPCGHRILCGTCGPTVPDKWKTTCMLCKTESVTLVRIFA